MLFCTEQGIAIAFAKAKAKAVVLTARDLGKLQEVEKEIIDSYPNTKVLVIKMDVTSESEVKAAFATAIEAFGAVNIAIHNAGSNNDFVPITQSDMSSWWSQYVSPHKVTPFPVQMVLQLEQCLDRRVGGWNV